MLARGGKAVDAVLAAAIALTVVEPMVLLVTRSRFSRTKDSCTGSTQPVAVPRG